jgi:hypothetical protein
MVEISSLTKNICSHSRQSTELQTTHHTSGKSGDLNFSMRALCLKAQLRKINLIHHQDQQKQQLRRFFFSDQNMQCSKH